MERAEPRVIPRFPSVRMTVNSTAAGKTGGLPVCGLRLSDIVGLDCQRGSRQGAQGRAKVLLLLLLLLKDRPGLEMRRWKQWGASQKEMTEAAREREDKNKPGARPASPTSLPVPQGNAVLGPKPCLGRILFISSQSPRNRTCPP